MNESKAVKVRLRDGATRECSIEVTEAPPWRLLFSGLDLKNREFSGDDLFDALIALRTELEGTGAQLLCAGARLDVFPSGMSRSMGGGRKAYATRPGAPALVTDLVDIFDYAGPEIVGSVAQQEAFHQEWVRSLA